MLDEEQTFRAIFDHAYEFVGLLSPDGTLLNANRPALEFVGAPRELVVGRPFWDTPWWLGSAAARARLRDAIPRAADGAFVRFEVEHRSVSGEARWFDFSLTPVREAGGRVLALVAEGRDITERRRAEQALQFSEARFHGIVSIAADAIVSVDEEQRITLFNAGAEATFGYATREVLGEPLALLIPDPYRARHAAHVEAFGRSGTPARRMGERGEIFGRRKNGEVFPAEASISQMQIAGHRFFTAVVRDVTERRRAEEERAQLLARERAARTAAELAEMRASFLAEASAVLDRSLDERATLVSLAALAVPRLAPVCIIDGVTDDGRVQRLHVQHADPARSELAAALLRYPRDPACPFLTRDALETGRTAFVPRMTDAFLRTHSADQAHLALLRALDPRSMISVPMIARGRTYGVFTLIGDADAPALRGDDIPFVEDVARRAALAVSNARLYEQARAASRLRDVVLGIVSHDLRNPLSAVTMYAGAILDVPDLPPRVARAAEGIRESTDWMFHLIGDLLDVSSIEAGKLSLTLRREDPMLAAIRATEMLEAAADAKGVTLAADLPDELPAIRADADRVVQVLSNLLGNAVKFTPAGGRVTLRAHRDGDAVTFAVEDTGRGIDAAHLPYVFDRFWHASGATRVRGTGLGLFIAQGIVHAHGGRIDVESEPGRGSAFRFSIPTFGRADRPGAVNDAAADRSEQPHSTG